MVQLAVDDLAREALDVRDPRVEAVEYDAEVAHGQVASVVGRHAVREDQYLLGRPLGRRVRPASRLGRVTAFRLRLGALVTAAVVAAVVSGRSRGNWGRRSGSRYRRKRSSPACVVQLKLEQKILRFLKITDASFSFPQHKYSLEHYQWTSNEKK